MLSYLPIYIAAIVEGEIYYSKVCADAVSGRLLWPAVLVCGALGGLPGITVPRVPPKRTHVYYQYCVYGPEGPKRDDLVVRCVRRGIDIETLHVDVPPDMPLFEGTRNEREGARRAAQAIQIPVHAGLTKAQLQRVAETVRDVLASSRSSVVESRESSR